MAFHLDIFTLANTSPTAAAEMSVCRLRAGLSTCKESGDWTIHDPRQWLGKAYHSLLEEARRSAAGADLERIWDSEISLAAQRAGLHQFDRRYSDPLRWPSYYLIRQRALSAASSIVSKTASSGRQFFSGPLRSGTEIRSGTEKKLVARAGKLVGRPDRFDRTTVTDYKSNLPDEASQIGSGILEGYRRQIRIYAAIIAEALGFWPATGVICGPSGNSITFLLDRSECDANADLAVADLEDWNVALASARNALDLASPSASACSNCRFQIVCPAFWSNLDKMPLERGPVAISGKLKAVHLGNDGDLQTVTFSDVTSTRPGSPEVSMVTRRSVHGDVQGSPLGTAYKVVGAGVRRNGRLSAEMSTVLMPAHQIPGISLHAGISPCC